MRGTAARTKKPGVKRVSGAQRLALEAAKRNRGRLTARAIYVWSIKGRVVSRRVVNNLIRGGLIEPTYGDDGAVAELTAEGQTALKS